MEINRTENSTTKAVGASFSSAPPHMWLPRSYVSGCEWVGMGLILFLHHFHRPMLPTFIKMYTNSNFIYILRDQININQISILSLIKNKIYSWPGIPWFRPKGYMRLYIEITWYKMCGLFIYQYIVVFTPSRFTF